MGGGRAGPFYRPHATVRCFFTERYGNGTGTVPKRYGNSTETVREQYRNGAVPKRCGTERYRTVRKRYSPDSKDEFGSYSFGERRSNPIRNNYSVKFRPLASTFLVEFSLPFRRPVFFLLPTEFTLSCER